MRAPESAPLHVLSSLGLLLFVKWICQDDYVCFLSAWQEFSKAQNHGFHYLLSGRLPQFKPFPLSPGSGKEEGPDQGTGLLLCPAVNAVLQAAKGVACPFGGIRVRPAAAVAANGVQMIALPPGHAGTDLRQIVFQGKGLSGSGFPYHGGSFRQVFPGV